MSGLLTRTLDCQATAFNRINQKIVERLERRVLLDAIPLGPEFLVNTHTTSHQQEPDIAVDDAGNSVVAWSSYTQDGSGWGVFGQRFNANGTAQGSEFRVNTFTLGNQSGSVTGTEFNYRLGCSVAMDADGDFVVAWNSRNQDGSESGIYAQRYDAQAIKMGDEFQVNTYTTSYQRSPKVAMNPSGDFVIVWTSSGADGSGTAVCAQRYDASGVPLSTEFIVNSFTSTNQFNADVAMDDQGEFVVTWLSQQAGVDQLGVHAQRYSAQGIRQGDEFRVDAAMTTNPSWVSVAMDANGAFVVAWERYGNDIELQVFARQYAEDGSPVGDEFRVDTASNFQDGPSVSMDNDGDFAIAWTRYGSHAGVYVRRYDSTGVLQGLSLQVTSPTSGKAVRPSIVMDTDGDFVVTWTSTTYQAGDGYNVYARRFDALQTPEVTAANFVFDVAPQRLQVLFNENVSGSLTLDDFVIQALPNGPTIDPTGLAYDLATNTATVFLSALPDASFRATLAADGIFNLAGSTMKKDYTFEFFYLMADANHDTRVNLADFNILAANFGQSPRDFTEGDFNYDGVVNLADFNLLASRFGQSLAPDGSMATIGQRLPAWPGVVPFGERIIGFGDGRTSSGESDDEFLGLS